jgi:outer membrane beta-barrel protein
MGGWLDIVVKLAYPHRVKSLGAITLTLVPRIAALALLCATATTARGETDATPTLPSEAPLPSCLDRTIRDELGAELRPRGVQKRDFVKRRHLAVVARAGLYGGDLTSSNWLAGGALQYYFTEDFGIEASFDVTPVVLDLDAPLAKFFGDDRFRNGFGYLGLVNMVWSPIHAKLKAGDGIIHADVLAFAGAGRLFHPSVQGVTADVGLALDLFISKPVTVRFDVRDVIAVQEATGQTRLTNNLVTSVAIVFWIPTWL